MLGDIEGFGQNKVSYEGCIVLSLKGFRHFKLPRVLMLLFDLTRV